MKKQGKCFGLIILIVLGFYFSFHYWNSAQTKNEPTFGAWYYDIEDHHIEDAITLCVQNNWTFLFLSVNTHAINQTHSQYNATLETKLVALLTLAHQNAIKIHLMTLEDPVFCEPAKNNSAHQRIQEILQFNLNHPSTQFDGIHLDVEPQAHSEWDAAGDNWTIKNSIFQNWLSLLAQLRNQINSYKETHKISDFPLSAAIAYWYNEKTLSGELINGSPGQLNQYLDFLVPMVYGKVWGSVNEMIVRVSDEVGGAPTIIGLSNADFNNQTFKSQIQTDLVNYYQNNTNFQGIAWFHAGNYA